MKKILNSFIPLFVFSMCLTSCGDNASSSSIESFDSDSEAVVIEDIPNESFHTIAQAEYLADTYDSVSKYASGTKEMSIPYGNVFALKSTNAKYMCVSDDIDFSEYRLFNIEGIKASDGIVGQLYPEIFSCIGCNACTKGCPQGLNVMQYIAYAQRGEYEKAAHASFDCVGCNICASRCPAQISHSAVGLLCRRLTGKYIAPKCEHLAQRVAEIETGDYVTLLEKLKNMPLDEIKDLYNKREIEK